MVFAIPNPRTYKRDVDLIWNKTYVGLHLSCVGVFLSPIFDRLLIQAYPSFSPDRIIKSEAFGKAGTAFQLQLDLLNIAPYLNWLKLWRLFPVTPKILA
jgi:hypothetical protein